MSITYEGYRKLNPQPKLTPIIYTTGSVPGGTSALEGISSVLINVTSTFGLNPTGNARYLQFFELAPTNGAIPDVCFYVPANSNFSWTPSQGGRVFDSMYFGVSSTAATFTAAADEFIVYVEGQIL